VAGCSEKQYQNNNVGKKSTASHLDPCDQRLFCGDMQGHATVMCKWDHFILLAFRNAWSKEAIHSVHSIVLYRCAALKATVREYLA